MELENIYNAIGKPGLYELISTNKAGVIIESLTDKKRYQIFGTDKSASLQSIQIITVDGEVPLKDVFKTIYTKENGGECMVQLTDNNALKKYMIEILPNYDQSKVYVSDMKKLFSWYNILIKADKLDFLADYEPSDSTEENTEESK